MAIRQVYIPKDSAPYYHGIDIEFEWNSGFTTVQKQTKATDNGHAM